MSSDTEKPLFGDSGLIARKSDLADDPKAQEWHLLLSHSEFWWNDKRKGYVTGTLGKILTRERFRRGQTIAAV